MQDLSNINTIKEILSAHGFTFSKSLGQNFLINPTVCPRMAEACGASSQGGVLEIGPGIGTMTQYLAERAGSVVAVEDLFRAVWNEDFMPGSNNTVMVHIRHLREKMSGPTGKSDFIKTVWGVGYKVEE